MNLTDTFQAYSLGRPGHWPLMLTDYPERVSDAAAAPQGPGLVISRDQGANENHQLYWMDLDSKAVTPLTDNPQAMHIFGDFAPDASQIAYTGNDRNGRDFDLYIQSVSNPKDVRLAKELGGHWEVKRWNPDHTLILQERIVYSVDEHLYQFKDDALLPLSPHDAAAVFDSPVRTSDGSLYVRTDYHRDYVGVARLDSPSQVKFVVAAEADVDLLAGREDSPWLAYALNRDGFSELHLCNTATGADHHIDAFDSQVVVELEFSADGQFVAVTHTSPTANLNISLVNLESGSVQPLTFAPMPGLDSSKFVKPAIIRCPSFDGLEIPAYVYRPRRAGKAPVVLSVHGGPEAQERPVFSALYQFLAAHGYAVVAPNVRGSTGYGKAYSHLDDRDKRMDSVRDLEAVAQYIKSQPDLDGARIAIYGGSYGGFMVLSGITQYPDLFAAAVDLVGIANLETFLENTSPYRRRLRENEYGFLDTDREFLRRFSPIHHVDRIRTALFVVHGANDPRVPLNEAEQMVKALQDKGQPVEFRVFADEGHGIAKKSNRLQLYPEMVAFLDRNLKQA